MLRISLTKTACLAAPCALPEPGLRTPPSASPEVPQVCLPTPFYKKLIRCIWTLRAKALSAPMPERITRSLNRWWCASISLKIARPLTGWIHQQLLERGDILPPPTPISSPVAMW